MDGIRVVVVGNGALAEQLSRLMATSGWYRLEMLVSVRREAPRLQALAAALGVDYRQPVSLREPSLIDEIDRRTPDYLLSVDNFEIFPPTLLHSARIGCVNFHNGPLPRYRGLNIPSWVIWNGETEHSVTWHVMEEKLDSGPVVLSLPVPLAYNETAASLTLKCMTAGIRSLPQLLERLTSCRLPEAVEPAERGTYYARHQVPADGIIDPSWPVERMQRLVRALDYGRLPFEHIGPARMRINGVLREVRSVEPLAVPRKRSGGRDVRVRLADAGSQHEIVALAGTGRVD